MDVCREHFDQFPPRAYRAVFFDLDGTLLPMELEEFLGKYFETLGAFVSARGHDAHAFSTALKAGIASMSHHDGTRSNADAFWNSFLSRVDADACDWVSLVEEFYANDFGTIGADVVPNPAAARVIETLSDKGYPLVLATMPLFPRCAVEWRLNWAGVDASSFERVTTYENSTSVKPRLAYYEENLAAAGLTGGDVLMVGNNTVEDLAATQVGCDAFLVTDHLIDPVSLDVETVRHGSLAQLAAWAEGLPVCENPANEFQGGLLVPAAVQGSNASPAQTSAFSRIAPVSAE